jgi:hypothetical protein
MTSVGTTVIIADNNSGPGTTTNPELLFAQTTAGTTGAGTIMWQPEKAPKGPVSIIISAADGAGYIDRNGSKSAAHRSRDSEASTARMPFRRWQR